MKEGSARESGWVFPARIQDLSNSNFHSNLLHQSNYYAGDCLVSLSCQTGFDFLSSSTVFQGSSHNVKRTMYLNLYKYRSSESDTVRRMANEGIQ